MTTAGEGTSEMVKAYSPCCAVPLCRRIVAPMFQWISDGCRSVTCNWATIMPCRPAAAMALDAPSRSPSAMANGSRIAERLARLRDGAVIPVAYQPASDGTASAHGLITPGEEEMRLNPSKGVPDGSVKRHPGSPVVAGFALHVADAASRSPPIVRKLS